VIYTTNAIESVNMTLRKVTRNHRIFPSDEAVYKVVAPFDAQHRRSAWTMPIRDWKPARGSFAIEFEGRFPQRAKSRAREIPRASTVGWPEV